MNLLLPTHSRRPLATSVAARSTMPCSRRSAAALAAGFLVALPCHAETPATPAGGHDADVVELSPFLITDSRDVGYQATNTLAGTRLNTSLKDVGAAVSVYNAEFLEDIAVNKLEDILTYTASTEGGGINGNYSGIAAGAGSADVRDDPSSVNRVRGLAQATRTRDFFPSDIPSDSFSFNTVTINRGPNAILAGVGSAGGIIDAGLRRALYQDRYNVTTKLGEYGSNREELHLNKVIVPRRLAVRVDALNDQQIFRQDPAFARDQRVYGAVNFRAWDPTGSGVLGRGTFRANFETGRITGVPPDPLTPLFSFSSWFDNANPAAIKWRWDGARQVVVSSTGATLPSSAITAGFPLFRNWALVFANPNSTAASVGFKDADLAAVQGFQGTIPGSPQGPGGALRGTGDPLRLATLRTRLSNRAIFDFYDNLMTGEFDHRDQRFNAGDYRFEQLLFKGDAGFEAAFNRQSFTRTRFFPIAGGDEDIYVDVNSVLSIRTPTYPNGVPNPNFGRPFIESNDAFRDQKNRTDRDAYQITAFLKHDFTKADSPWVRWLGRHSLSALAFETDIKRSNRTYRSTWDPTGQLNPQTSTAAAPGTFAAQVNAWFYVGDSLVNAPTLNDVRLQRINTGRPQYGQTYTLRVYDPVSQTFVTGTSTPLRVLGNVVDQKETVKSTAVALESHWLKDHVITVFGLRDDNDKGQTSSLPATLPNGGLDDSNIVFQPSVKQSKQSTTKSVVGVFPAKLPFDSDLRAYWNDSDNFNPVGQRRNIWNEPLGSPSASTREYGVNLSMFGGKFGLRVNRYRTAVANDSIAGVGNPYSYISGLIQRLLGARDLGLKPSDWGYNYAGFNTFSDVALAIYNTIPDRMKANIGPDKNFNPHFTGSGSTLQWNPDSITNLASTSDTVSTGTEFEAIINPLRNWRISLSAAKTEAVKSSVAVQELAFAAAWKQNLDTMYGGSLLTGARNPPTEALTFWDQYVAEQLPSIRRANALSGTATPEIRKWRFNLVTRYDFRWGFLRGFRVGGALRWQDRVGIGYPLIKNAAGDSVADITRPYWGPTETVIDLSAGYHRRLKAAGREIDWDIGLNVRNLNARDQIIPIAANPDGTYGTFRIPPERQVSVTNSFTF